MTNDEKKMRKYLRSVKRQLNLPKDIKERVMSDFTSSIEARREAGQTDEAIYAELGSAKKAAADLNEQMKEFAYRKSPWRFAFAACAVYGGVKLLGGLGALYLVMRVNCFAPAESASVGVIGGADGPTAIFVTSPVWTAYILPVVLLIVGIWGFIRLRKCKQRG